MTCCSQFFFQFQQKVNEISAFSVYNRKTKRHFKVRISKLLAIPYFTDKKVKLNDHVTTIDTHAALLS